MCEFGFKTFADLLFINALAIQFTEVVNLLLFWSDDED